MTDTFTLRCIGGPLHGQQFSIGLSGSLRFPVERNPDEEPGETTYIRRTARVSDGNRLVFDMEYLAWDGIDGETADKKALGFICKKLGGLHD